MKNSFYKLSETIEYVDGELIKEGTYETLGLSNSKIKNKFLTFAEDPKFFDEILNNQNVSCVITKKEFFEYFMNSGKGIMVSGKPRLDFFHLHNKLAEMDEYRLKPVRTTIGKNCNISTMSYIDPENVMIGDNVIIEEFVSIRGNCVIGNNVTIKSGCQIGGEGYEFKPNGEQFYNVKHCGKVVIMDDVTIWPNTSIHKAVYPWDQTYIGKNTNINSRVHIDHGVKIGNRCEICAGAIISGRCVIGNHAFIGPGAVLSNRINVGEEGRISLGSVVTKDVGEKQTVSGNFAIDHKKFLHRLKGIDI